MSIEGGAPTGAPAPELITPEDMDELVHRIVVAASHPGSDEATWDQLAAALLDNMAPAVLAKFAVVLAVAAGRGHYLAAQDAA